MPRVQRAAILFLAVCLPLTALALGLGEIQLRSALNQPLAASIPISTDSSDELADLRVSLASPETFQRFGLDRPAYLEGVSFQVRREGGVPVIQVSSPEPIGEPFVSLLLDVSWPQGRLLREYTVLLDPPTFADQPAPPPVAVAPAPAPTAPASAPIRRPAEPAPPPAAPAPRVTSGPDGSTYGPVRANETLWAISERLRADSGATLDQMMMALYRANPDAFAGNINRLKRGAILRVPEAAEIGSLPGSQAAVEVQRQNEAWRGRAAEPPVARLQLVPPAEVPATSSNAVPAPVTTAGQPTAPAATAPVSAEAELAEARRLLALKDSQLKALQDRLAAAEGQQQSVAEAPQQAEPGTEVAVERLPAEGQAPAGETDEAAVEAETATPAVKAAARPDRQAKPRKVRESGGSWLDSVGALVFNTWFLLAAAVVLLAGLFLVFARRRLAADEGGRFGGVAARGGMLGGAAASAASVARAPEGFVVEEEDVADRTMSTPVLGRGAPARGPAAGSDAEAPLERTISTDGAVELDQADVIAEADFHMAYGLYDQAAELLTRALKNSPDRRDLRMKLLEVYFIWENKPAFLREAQAFQAQLKGGADPDWNKVVIMGKQICPDEALFAGAVSGASADVIDFTLADDDKAGDVDVSFDEASATGVDLDLTGAQQVAESDLLDFDFGEVAGTDDTSVTPTEVAPGVRTTEVPTIEARYGAADASPTMETPTVESRGLETPTLETPTIETAAAGGTMETPTLENSVAGLRAGIQGEGGDHTEELNVEDLGLDLTGLDQAAGDLGTGIHGALGADEQAGADQDVFDIGAMEEDEASDLLQSLESDATAEMRGMAVDEGTLDLPAFGTAMEKSARGRTGGGADRGIEDTAEQPRVTGLPGGELGDQSGELSQVDFDIGADTDPEDDLEATSVAAAQTGTRRRPEGPTMTEVGTKLDLARAYVDMGDPEGARSILNEVLEEGDTAQRQEARKLLDDLAG